MLTSLAHQRIAYYEQETVIESPHRTQEALPSRPEIWNGNSEAAAEEKDATPERLREEAAGLVTNRRGAMAILFRRPRVFGVNAQELYEEFLCITTTKEMHAIEC